MSDVALAAPAAARVPLRDLADMPCDMIAMMAAAHDMDPRQFGVWQRLRMHLYAYGELPVTFKALAAIGGVGTKSLERMAPALARHFDGGADGRWTDHALIRARGSRVVVPAQETRVDPTLSAKRAAIGRRGAKRRWEPRVIGSESGKSAAPDAETPAPEFAIVAMAKQGGFAMGEMAKEDVFAIDPPSKLASSSESDGKTDELASKQAGKTRAVTSADLANPMAKSSDGGMANGMANGAARPPPSDVAIIDAVIRVCEHKVTKAQVHERLPLYRAAIGDGLDFFVDILPKVQSFARGKAKIDNCANTHIIAEARQHFESRRATASNGAVAAVTEMVKIYRDDPDYAESMEAALVALGKTRKMFFQADAEGPYCWFDKGDWTRALAQATATRSRDPPP